MRKLTVYPGWFGDNLAGRVSALNFLGGTWEDDDTPALFLNTQGHRGSGDGYVQCLGQVALRRPLRAQHCMENRKMIPMYPKKHRRNQIIPDMERQILGRAETFVG